MDCFAPLAITRKRIRLSLPTKLPGESQPLSLSDRRAESAATLLTQQFGVPAENLTSQGYGEQYLKVPTDGPERRNRRVTVRNITPLLHGGEANAAPR